MKRLKQIGLIFMLNCLLTGFYGTAQKTITAYQYWFDHENSMNTVVTVTPAKELFLETAVSFAPLSTGLHVFTIRFRDNAGLWSSPVNHIFYYAGLVNNQITGYQYWFDDKFASNQVVPVTPQQNLQLIDLVSFATLSEGLHVFNIRFRDSKGFWSIPASQFFYKTGTIFNEENKIIGYRYWLNSDIANVKRQSVENPSQLLNINTKLDISWLKSGDHTISFQFEDSRHIWSVPVTYSFTYENRMIQRIAFSAGWNIFSVNVIPINPDLGGLFQPLIDNTSLVKIQDELGNALENWKMFGGWINNIGNIDLCEGYKIKLTKNDTVEITGEQVEFPFPIPLKEGWNIVGYPQKSSFNAMENIVKQLIDRETLIKVQDESGNSIEHWGVFGGWQNNVGNFVPGEGYKIKVNVKDTLWIYGNYPKSNSIIPDKIDPLHFRSGFIGSGVDHMNINLVELPLNILRAGDELAVFDGEKCVGVVTLMPHHLRSQTVSIAASATDNQGVDGFEEGNTWSLKLWGSTYKKEFLLDPEIISGTSTFVKHESTVAS